MHEVFAAHQTPFSSMFFISHFSSTKKLYAAASEDQLIQMINTAQKKENIFNGLTVKRVDEKVRTTMRLIAFYIHRIRFEPLCRPPFQSIEAEI